MAKKNTYLYNSFKAIPLLGEYVWEVCNKYRLKKFNLI